MPQIDDDPFETPAADEHAADASSDTSMVEHKDQILYGSDTLPATFQIDGETVALGVIVAAAFEKSGLTEDAWNALSEEDRDAKLHAELDARGANGPEGQSNQSGTTTDDRKVLAGGPASTATHDTGHDTGLSDQDARVPSDAAPLATGTKVVDDPKDPLGSLPDTAKTTATVPEPLTIDTDLPDRQAAGLIDAVIPTKPGGADEQDVLNDHTKDVVSKAPKRAPESLVNELDLAWAEFKHKVSMVTGDIGGELGEVLTFVRRFL